ncbi:hypothetical protein [Fusobacterium polymorphum]
MFNSLFIIFSSTIISSLTSSLISSTFITSSVPLFSMLLTFSSTSLSLLS